MKMRKCKKSIMSVAVVALIICSICPTLAVNAEERDYVSISIENPGEYKPPVTDEDLIKMGIIDAEDTAESWYTNDAGGYTVTSDSILVIDWNKSIINRDKVTDMAIYSFWLNGHGDDYGELISSEDYDRIEAHWANGMWSFLSENEQPDVVYLYLKYLDDNSNQRYHGTWFPVQKTNYNISFKSADVIIEEGPEGTMYRLYNSNSGEHFYTANVEEARYLYSIGWRYEDYAWTAPTESNAPVYRLYNSNAGYHHYTTSGGERDYLVSIGWTDEGIAWYSDTNNSTPLYRLYNPNATGQYEAGAHHYTTNTAERDQLIAAGWIDEGIGWYGL